MQKTATIQDYKQTEVGLIPIDWEVKRLGLLGKFSKGQGVRKDEASSGAIPCVRYGELYTRHDNYIREFYSFISEDIANTSKRLKNGDVLFAGSGETKTEIGKSVAFIDNIEAYAGGDIVILSTQNVEPLFLGYLLNAPIIQKQKASRGQGDAVVHISATQLGNIQIPIPPLPEQEAIATALKETDILIQNLEELIDKKKLIKQGAMQELLKPKEGWVTKKLGEVGRTFGGLSGKSKVDFYKGGSSYIPFMNIMSNPVIDTNYFDSVIIGINEKQNKCLKGDLFLNGSSETPEEVGMCSVLMDDIENLYLNSFCFGYRIFTHQVLDGLFLTYFLRSSYGRALIYSSAQGATRYNLSKANFLQLEVKLPEIAVQKEITNFISDIDNEIEFLEQKLFKYKTIKHGMKQQLLTGKIRLI